MHKAFNDAAHQEAFEKWHAYLSARGVWLGPDALVNVAAAQKRNTLEAPHCRPVYGGRTYTYMEYFTRAAWDKNMPPIERVQITDPIPTFEGIPDITVIPDLQLLYGFDFPVYR